MLGVEVVQSAVNGGLGCLSEMRCVRIDLGSMFTFLQRVFASGFKINDPADAVFIKRAINNAGMDLPVMKHQKLIFVTLVAMRLNEPSSAGGME